MMKRRHYYNRTNTCDNIKKDGTQCGNKLIPGKTYREYDKKGDWTGRWICDNCRKTGDNKERRSVLNCRTGNYDSGSTKALGDNCEKLSMELFKVKVLSIECDRYSGLPLDHSPIPEGTSVMVGDKLVDLSGKIPQTKGRCYNSDRKGWRSINTEREWYKESDVIILYCVSKDGNTIERIYILPKEEILGIKSIGIYKYNSKGDLYENGWYEKYRVKDEKILEYANKIWKKILEKRK